MIDHSEGTGSRLVIREQPQAQPVGWTNGVLHCYGGCGTRYIDFHCDMLLPTPLWNRIAVGPPFDNAQVGIDREGRGGVLCPSCIVQRLMALTEATAVFADIVDPRESIERLQAENICDACCGTGKAPSGDCMCGGTGRMSDAAIYLREELVSLRRQVQAVTQEWLSEAKAGRDSLHVAAQYGDVTYATQMATALALERCADRLAQLSGSPDPQQEHK